MAQLGRALRSGRRGRGFESRHPDHSSDLRQAGGSGLPDSFYLLWGEMLETVFATLGYGLCHQIPERSFFAGGYQLPVCARDTGLYLGFALGLAALWFLHRDDRPSLLPPWPVNALIAVFISSLVYDGASSYMGLRETTNDIRLLTGMLAGWGLSALLAPMLNGQLWSRPGETRVLGALPEIGKWLAILVVSWAVTRWLLPQTGVLYPLLVTAAILLSLGAMNLVIVSLSPRFERRAARADDLWLASLVALLLACLEVGGAYAMRAAAEGALL